ncbi:MAG: hypothetical protein A3C85_03130 [Candidatus Doudnabacteria bacterium RIFCSPHIGHO2_02_FULL_48_21]|uniref:Peptidase S26 domain-containing protein n=1 Tax=Candidatus Doudnabacteria bacterium RIFCSPLOWO2_02_FULL_48_13 TaxID=1817845 RepID=A0A1F5QC51_9BACT|nr:MAG: hypothetical protein A3K05_00390 [Candidatus Doudnabacteria bacterium RIFCSPHIGHO2_01_48_18]OGE77720.1 MAG: hypothetical protein A2668_02920 [Candidatus Doudnabacteria bacterium RIFCSPHIGHO2_01_FULL_48_180]OGE91639.1 MAG: hypothetical protein A3F44_02960 [Candidatus Doudnabacteria bacterium RIFCSPHIGHO2_12_FULL_47_25]OGE93253.1 MAG: hypothetical protein A3C85_03130 [Candidatus Doudnabacteria bacterium RIFCSPHIGHO2_02_FULL_48_21]OGE99736.1 MAG: hypothetical protein A3J05_01890 [Candidatu
MLPLIKDGQLFFINQWAYLLRGPATGDVIVFQNPANKTQRLCKRVAAVQGDYLTLLGDNSLDSLDSRSLGQIALKNVIGRVIEW